MDGAIDFPPFAAEFNQAVPNSAFDFNADGFVNNLDFPAFGTRYNVTL